MSLLLVFTLSLSSLLLLWLLFLYTHNQYNYSNNYQIINYSFKGYFLDEQWDVFYLLSLIGSFWSMLFCFRFIITIIIIIIAIIIIAIIVIIILFTITVSIIIICFFFSPFCKCMYCFISPYFLFFFFMPLVKDQQSHSLHLVLVYFIFVTNMRFTNLRHYYSD